VGISEENFFVHNVFLFKQSRSDVISSLHDRQNLQEFFFPIGSTQSFISKHFCHQREQSFISKHFCHQRECEVSLSLMCNVR
jgi:hypothetical protein